MEIQVTSFSSFPAPTKASEKNNDTTLNSQKTDANNPVVILSKKESHKLALSKPLLSLKMTPRLIQQHETSNKTEEASRRGILLYQQVERNKNFSNGTELINNLFHLKA